MFGREQKNLTERYKISPFSAPINLWDAAAGRTLQRKDREPMGVSRPRPDSLVNVHARRADTHVLGGSQIRAVCPPAFMSTS